MDNSAAGRHSFPASEFTRDRFYMTPSARAKKAHGIGYWPDPPVNISDLPLSKQSNFLIYFLQFKSGGDSADREHSIHFKDFQRRSSISLTPPSREPARVHTTGGRQGYCISIRN